MENNKDEKDFLKRLDDKIGKVLKKHTEERTDFLDPFLLGLARDYLRHQQDLNYASFGGVEDAERSRMVICPEYLEPTAVMGNISIVGLTGKIDYVNVTHRDCLGALLGQGIKRERVGDLYLTDKGFVCILSQEVAQYVMMNPPKIKGVTLTPRIYEPGQWQPSKDPGKAVNTTVASLRLDTLVANGFSLSRTKVLGDIKGGKVQVNWQVIDNISYQCKEEDVISFRGRGRIVISQVKGQSKKGRTVVELLRF